MMEDNSEADAITQAVVERKQRAEERKQKEEREKSAYLDQLTVALCDHFGFDREAALTQSVVQRDGYQIILRARRNSVAVAFTRPTKGRQIITFDDEIATVYTVFAFQKYSPLVSINPIGLELEGLTALLTILAATQEVADVFSKVPTPAAQKE